MYRIVGRQFVNGKGVGGVLLEGNRVPDSWDVSVFEVNGHKEISARPVIEWKELCEYEDHLRDWPDQRTAREIEFDEEQRRLRCQKVAANRAKTICRRKIKASNFREMLTGTYRENQTDGELFKLHLSKFIDAIRYVLPKVQYCVAFEKQERGAWHFHMATNKLPRFVRYKGEKIEGWLLPTMIWRGIVGADNGLVFVGGKPRWGSARRRNQSIAKIASYVSKYILEDSENTPFGEKRYWSSRSIEPMPKPTHFTLHGRAVEELVSAIFECPPGHAVVSHRIGRWGDSYWLCTEPESPAFH